MLPRIPDTGATRASASRWVGLPLSPACRMRSDSVEPTPRIPKVPAWPRVRPAPGGPSAPGCILPQTPIKRLGKVSAPARPGSRTCQCPEHSSPFEGHVAARWLLTFCFIKLCLAPYRPVSPVLALLCSFPKADTGAWRSEMPRQRLKLQAFSKAARSALMRWR